MLGEIGTTILLLGLSVVNILLLTHWSLSRGAEKVGTRAQKISAKTGEKLGGVAQRIREKKAAMDAARSAARLEELKDKPTEFIFKKKKQRNRKRKKNRQWRCRLNQKRKFLLLNL